MRSDCVTQASDSVNDGHCSIGHGIELVEPTWLEARGHQEHVDTCSNPVCHLDGEADPSSALVLVPADQGVDRDEKR